MQIYIQIHIQFRYISMLYYIQLQSKVKLCKRETHHYKSRECVYVNFYIPDNSLINVPAFRAHIISQEGNQN